MGVVCLLMSKVPYCNNVFTVIVLESRQERETMGDRINEISEKVKVFA